ncbi:hypothetical protein ACN27G_15085 [Plantactinospora sp. WMMB334]|uniref:hypothetical protein n=1 Tax=Plantactinospora sp. WMMB334 TaxID=3404119 RepID=UPI003B95A290
MTHEDAGTRSHAEERVRRWSRAPVAGLPVWVIPQVVRGGFATGSPAADGPLHPYEMEPAARVGVPAERGALFAYFLTEAGQAEL